MPYDRSFLPVPKKEPPGSPFLENDNQNDHVLPCVLVTLYPLPSAQIYALTMP